MSEVKELVKETPKETPKEYLHKILQKDFQQVEFVYARMAATLPAGWAFEETLRPEFWANVSYMMQARPLTQEGDRTGGIIEVRTADHAFYAELYIRAVQTAGLVVSVIREPVYFGPKLADTARFEVRWNVGNRGFDIIRKSDREIVASSTRIKTREQAKDWIDKSS